MNTIMVIGRNTFLEAIRNKVLASMFFFATAVIVASLAFGSLSVQEEVRLTTDLGFAGMSVFLVLIAIFIGVNLVYKELERKTIYSLIPKPVHRFQFVLGKFVGLSITLLVLGLLMSLVLVVVLLLQGAELRGELLRMGVLIMFEGLVITAVAVLFSSFSTPLLSGLFTAGIFLVGRSVPEIVQAAGKMKQPLQGLLRGAAAVVPNLSRFYISGGIVGGQHVSVHGAFVDWPYVAMAGSYALLYMALVLLVAVALFSRRDFV